MKKIILSLGSIVATLAVATGATFAIFSDSSSFNGNTVSTAKVDINALSEPNGNLPKPLNVSGLVPGEWTDWARGVIFNTAESTDVKLYMYVDNKSGAACDKINLEVTTGHAGSDAQERLISLYNGALSGLEGSANRVEITGTGKIFDPTIAPNHSAVIQQRAQLDGSADNSYQNTSCSWDEVFVGETPAL